MWLRTPASTLCKRGQSLTFIRSIVRGGEARATALLTSKLEELHRVRVPLSFSLKPLNSHQLAHALVEHETLDSDEVKKVIKGEPIRNITDVLNEELSNMSAGAGAHMPASAGASGL